MFLTTHYLDEADALSDRIMIIDQGRIVASDTADNLKAQVAGDLVDLEVEDPDQVALAAERLAGLGGDVETDDRHVRARVARAGKAVPGLLRDLAAHGIALESIEIAPADARRRLPHPDRPFPARRGGGHRRRQPPGHTDETGADQ